MDICPDTTEMIVARIAVAVDRDHLARIVAEALADARTEGHAEGYAEGYVDGITRRESARS